MNEKEYFKWAGQRYKAMREGRGVSQTGVSTTTGIDRSIISKFENNGKKVSTFRIKQLLEAIDYTLSDLEIGSEPTLEKKTLSTSRYPYQPVMA